jgi:hypothetical protein
VHGGSLLTMPVLRPKVGQLRRAALRTLGATSRPVPAVPAPAPGKPPRLVVPAGACCTGRHGRSGWTAGGASGYRGWRGEYLARSVRSVRRLSGVPVGHPPGG